MTSSSLHVQLEQGMAILDLLFQTEIQLRNQFDFLLPGDREENRRKLDQTMRDITLQDNRCVRLQREIFRLEEEERRGIPQENVVSIQNGVLMDQNIHSLPETPMTQDEITESQRELYRTTSARNRQQLSSVNHTEGSSSNQISWNGWTFEPSSWTTGQPSQQYREQILGFGPILIRGGEHLLPQMLRYNTIRVVNDVPSGPCLTTICDSFQETSTEQDKEQCAICYTNKRSVIHLPCAHITTCRTCVEKDSKKSKYAGVKYQCSVCRTPVDEIKRVLF